VIAERKTNITAVSDPCGVSDIERVDSNVLATDLSFFSEEGYSKEASQDLTGSPWQRHAAGATVRV
jgi:hypothetical protein